MPRWSAIPQDGVTIRSKHGARTRALRGKDRAGPLYKGMDRGARRERHYGPWGPWENFKKI